MRTHLFIAVLLAAGPSTWAEDLPVSPYTDPAQLQCPWPKMSHYKQPWRGFLETRSAYDFLQGIGVNLHVPDRAEETAIRLLAETGFKTFRIEVGWGGMNWEQTRLNNESKIRRSFELCAQYGIRPTILINAHQGVPCPVKFFSRRLIADAIKGTKSVKLNNVKELIVGRSGLSGLSDYWAAEALITGIDEQSGEVTLSKPLPKDLKAGPVQMATLKYAPLHPIGTTEFDDTAAGWVKHTLHVCRLARESGVQDFDVEIWNELTFGTHFLNINDYYDKAAPRITQKQPDFLNRGGRCWELARRTVEAVKKEFPRARCIWGFSNTTFFHCAVKNLPPGMDGQSYHPYGTGTRKFDGQPPRKDQPSLKNFVPSYEIRMPEGWAGTFIQTECLMRLLNPADRLANKAEGSTRCYHYMTEHGVLPPECGVNDDTAAWDLKARCATRSFCFWLNKGIDALHYFDAFESKATSFGVLPVNLRDLPADVKFESAATPPMRALRNLTRAFAGSVPLTRTDSLQIEVTALGPDTKVFDGDATHPPLWNREVLAALPFQVNPGKHIIVVYVMTRDAVKPFAPANYRLKINGFSERKKIITCYDPHEDKEIPVKLGNQPNEVVEATLAVLDHPRLLTIE